MDNREVLEANIKMFEARATKAERLAAGVEGYLKAEQRREAKIRAETWRAAAELLKTGE